MKKSFAFILVALCLHLSNNAQNSLIVKIHDNLCLDEIHVTFQDDSSDDFSVGCAGEHVLDIGDHLIESLSINGTPCAVSQTTQVRVNNNTPGAAYRNVPRYIVKADGIVYEYDVIITKPVN